METRNAKPNELRQNGMDFPTRHTIVTSRRHTYPSRVVHDTCICRQQDITQKAYVLVSVVQLTSLDCVARHRYWWCYASVFSRKGDLNHKKGQLSMVTTNTIDKAYQTRFQPQLCRQLSCSSDRRVRRTQTRWTTTRRGWSVRLSTENKTR